MPVLLMNGFRDDMREREWWKSEGNSPNYNHVINNWSYPEAPEIILEHMPLPGIQRA